MAYLIADHIISPLGFGTAENFDTLCQGHSGLAEHIHPTIGPYIAAKIDREKLQLAFSDELSLLGNFTFAEQLCILSVKQVAQKADLDLKSSDTLLVFSTTKGNIDLLHTKQFDQSRVRLGKMAEMVSTYLGNPNKPIVVSNACISGVQALLFSMQVLHSKRYKRVVVCGVDILSDFVLAGFSSFQALSLTPCKPFDKNRTGLNIGEACVSMVISLEESGNVRLSAGASANDANHLSGPSRTGEGLSLAIKRSLANAGISPQQIDYISAHGTATPYNDEMEALAFQTEKLSEVPLNSFKGYFGHTLGAAGVLESCITAQCIKQNKFIHSLGFEHLGVSVPLHVIQKTTDGPIHTALKTASGFGGGNAALIITKA